MKKEQLLKRFSNLNYSKQQELIELLTNQVIESRPILNHKEKPSSCPHCNHNKIYKHGVYKIKNKGKEAKITGGTRYKCQGCKKTFNELTGTSIHAIKKTNKFRKFVELMLESKSIREAAQELNVSTKTIFDWRHKILASFENIFTKEFKGIVETDDVIYKLDQKGRKNGRIDTGKKKQGVNNKKHVSVMITMDRYKTYDFKLVSYGKVTAQSLHHKMNISKFNKENIICSDRSTALVKFFKDLELEHVTFKAKDKRHPIQSNMHVNNLNNTVGQLKVWVRLNFKSVATKYLENYLNWFLMLEILKKNNNKTEQWWDYMLKDSDTFKRSKLYEEKYMKFIGHSTLS